MVLLHHRPSSAHILLQSTHELLFLLRDWMFPSDLPADHPPPPPPPQNSIHHVWLESRRFEHKSESGILAPGAHRQLNLRNIALAYEMLRVHTFEMFRTIWVPRTSLVFLFNLCRGVFPAFRGYSQALIIDEVRLLITRACPGPFSSHVTTQVHSLVASRSFTWARLLRLLATECIRMLVESGLDTFAYAPPPLSPPILAVQYINCSPAGQITNTLYRVQLGS